LLQLRAARGGILRDMPLQHPPIRAAWPALLAGLYCLAPAAHGAGQQVHRFEVLLDGKPVGTHDFHESIAADGAREVRSEARFDVRMLGLTLYRYRHDAREQWQAGCLRRIDAETRDGGEQTVVQGELRNGRFQLSRPVARASASPCLSSYAYWDPALLLAQRELLNPQTGVIDAVQFEALGEEVIQVQGTQRPARRHRLRSAGLAIDLWYSPEGEWLQLASAVRGERQLLYRRR
jgi:hypothetical protein